MVTLDLEESSVKLYSCNRFFIEQYFDEQLQVIKISIAKRSDMLKYLKNITLKDLGYPTVQ